MANMAVITTQPETPEAPKGAFIVRNGRRCAGMHLLVDLEHATNLDRLDHAREALVDAAETAGATVLHVKMHNFGSGISGVVVLSESHISIHTWPEYEFAALDMFMCGSCDPYLAVPVLREAFLPSSIRLEEVLRGAWR